MTRFLISSALPYINGIKHLGNLAGSMLPADIAARYLRMKGKEVLYICATDEHGTPAELAAKSAGQSVEEYCKEQHDIQRKIGEAFGLSWDWFGRSSSEHNHKLVQHFAEKLEQNGLIEERESEQVYSLEDRRFLPDRYIEGQCPHCQHIPARGDQCDNCGRLIDPVDLINPYSVLSGSYAIEVRKTRHLYLLQSKLVDRLRKWIDQQHNWPHLARSIAYKWLDEGLKDRCITRDLYWGIKVKQNGEVRKGFENKVFYVWFDAPIEYIGATIEYAEYTRQDWQSWWRLKQGADHVQYIQFMGKDNVAFHTISFPSTLLGSREDWKTVDRLKAFNWVNWYGGKFSTSKKRGVFMDQALELCPADYWRWYLTKNAPENSDTDFIWSHFQSVINKDLADVLGNFINRVIKFTHTRFEGRIPKGGEISEIEQALFKRIDQRLVSLEEAFEALSFRKMAADVRSIWVIGNEYLQQTEPWKQMKEDKDKAAVSIRIALNLCYLFGIISAPIMPKTAKKITGLFSKTANHWPEGKAMQILQTLTPGNSINALDPLFKKIEDTDRIEWEERFGGHTSSRAAKGLVS